MTDRYRRELTKGKFDAIVIRSGLADVSWHSASVKEIIVRSLLVLERLAEVESVHDLIRYLNVQSKILFCGRVG